MYARAVEPRLRGGHEHRGGGPLSCNIAHPCKDRAVAAREHSGEVACEHCAWHALQTPTHGAVFADAEREKSLLHEARARDVLTKFFEAPTLETFED